MAAGAIDIALSGGSDLSYVAKGAPEIAIAEMAGPPLFLGVVVPYNSPLKGPDDLKGKKISVSSGAGVTRWLIQKLVQQKGWGSRRRDLVAAGGSWAAISPALVTGQVDAAVTAAALGFKLEETKQGRLLLFDFRDRARFHPARDLRLDGGLAGKARSGARLLERLVRDDRLDARA